MTYWPKMESMVMVADGYFVSEEFKGFPESIKKGVMEHLQGVPAKVVGLELYDDNHRFCHVSDNGAWVSRVPIGFVEPVINNKPEDNNEPTSEEIKPAKAVDEKAVTVSFPFTDDIRVEDALLFFARNGYRAWIESKYKAILYRFEGSLNVEMPKGRT